MLAANSSYPPITITVNVASNAPSQVTDQVGLSGGGESSTPSASDPTTVNPLPVLSITLTNAQSFTQGQNGATYTATVSNSASAGPTTGTVTVTQTTPAGLTFVSMSGTGWNCASNTCSRADVLAANSSYPAITITVNVASNAPTHVTDQVGLSGGGESSTPSASDPTTVIQIPVLSISLTNSQSFTQGQNGATYTATVSNSASAGPTSGTVTVTQTTPTGLTFVSMSGSGWNCASNTCSRADVLAPNSSYPAITITVNVASNAPSQVTDQVGLTGGGNASSPSATDPTTVILLPVLSISLTNSQNFTQGQNGATYTATVSNAPSAGPTSGTVTVTQTTPAGLTFVSMSGSGWNCASNTCSRADVLSPNSSYPAITITVNVAANAPSQVTDQAGVSGGGNASSPTANDPTTVIPLPALGITITDPGNFAQGQTGAYTITVSNSPAAGPTSGTVTVTATLPTGLTLVSLAGTNWNCASNACSRSDILAAGAAYPAITATVSIASNAPASLTTQACVSGGNSAPASANDATNIAQTQTSVMTVTNTGSAPLTFTSVTFNGIVGNNVTQNSTCPAAPNAWP